MTFLSPAQMDTFAAQGYVIVNNALSDSELQPLNQEFDQLLTSESFKKAQIATGASHELIRGDWTYWLDEKSPTAFKKVFFDLKTWSLFLNENLFCGITKLEAHLAHYPAGPGYKKHWDQAKGNFRRKISLVLYLNSDWPKHNGGELILYSADSENILEEIEPYGGRLVMFRSDLFPHEVLPSLGARRSLTGWFRSDAL